MNIEEAIKELKNDVLETKPQPQTDKKKLIFDGRQFSLRLPKKFVEEAEIDLQRDRFEITLELPNPSKADGEKPKLNIELIRNG